MGSPANPCTTEIESAGIRYGTTHPRRDVTRLVTDHRDLHICEDLYPDQELLVTWGWLGTLVDGFGLCMLKSLGHGELTFLSSW
jgi:hypothetical protein